MPTARLGRARFGRTRLAAGLLAALAASPALAGDIIVPISGNPIGNAKAGNPPSEADYAASNIEIVDENLDKVSYRLEGIPTLQSLDTSKVRAIFHDPGTVPADLRTGEALLKRGDLERARAALEKVAKADAPGWAKAQAAYLAATTHDDLGEAEQDLAAFKAAYPRSFWVKQATEERARALLGLDRIADAKGEFESLKSLPGAGEAEQAEASYWSTWIDERVAGQKDDAAGLANAQKGYDALITRLTGKAQFEALLRRTQVGRASCLVGLGKAAEARADLEKLAVEVKGNPRVLAAIYNKLGAAVLRAAPAGDREAQRTALKHYLRVVVLYGDETGTDDDCGEAMYNAGLLFRDLRDTGPDYVQRARREWNECIQRYPGTLWATRSKEALAGR
jgi:tetratricopeptide (TPR) repeat protein